MRAAAAVLLSLLVLAPAAAEQDAQEEAWAPPADARERLERILKDPVFQLEEPQPGFVEQAITRFREFLFRILERAVEAMELNAVLVRLVLWAVIGFALAGAVWLVIRSTRDRLAFPDPAGGGADRPDARRRDRSPTELLASAAAAIRSGRGRDGLRLCLQACITALRSAGHLPDNRSLTDLEGAALLERSGPAHLRSPFRTLVRSHDRLVYAGGRPEPGELDRAVELASGIVSDESGRP